MMGFSTRIINHLWHNPRVFWQYSRLDSTLTSITINKMEQRILYIHSDELGKLREKVNILSKWLNIVDEIGNARQFKLVIDTNASLQDLIWLAKHRINPQARTDLLECIDSGTVQAYAPKRLVGEVEEHLPLISKEKSVPLDTMWDIWQIYKQKLLILDPDENLMKEYSNSVDPNDIDFIVLAKEINAYGILTNDKHIPKMGGHQVTREFVTNVRDYARSVVNALNIKLKGLMLGILTVLIVTIFIKSLRALNSRMLIWLIIGFLILALILLLHPHSRKKITSYWVKMKEKIPVILNSLEEIVVLAQQEDENAQRYLEKLGIDKPDVDV